MKLIAAAFACAFTVAPGIANAADIRWNPPAGTVIVISGDIEKGDDVRLQRTLDAMRAHITWRWLPTVELDSPGGVVGPAARMADILVAWHANTLIMPRATCASACALLFFAGTPRTLVEGGRLGVHRATIDGEESSASYDVSMFIAQRLASYGVSRATNTKLMATPPSRMAWSIDDSTNGDFDFVPMAVWGCGSQGCDVPNPPAWLPHGYRYGVQPGYRVKE